MFSTPSPCISICQMNPQSGLCMGCHRTIDEIADWSVLSEEEKQAVLSAIDARVLNRD